MELAFATPEIIYGIIEGLVRCMWKEGAGVDLPTSFPRMSFSDAISKYGSDKPDVRFGMQVRRSYLESYVR